MDKINNSIKYCNSLTKYKRYKTREVSIGGIALGGNNPIRIQSMTTTDTMDTHATVQQSIKMINAGCEYVRITAPSIKEALNLKNIKSELINKGYKTPLIADIHFTPNAAIEAARIVEKVRINPGNYADRKKFKSFEYTDEEYSLELERINEKFSPLVKVCKENGTAMRIGTNHGSLSDRIMNRYGDTPLGMVESALEFIRICESYNYYDIVLSMKSSNPIVMVQAYRLLINKMLAEKMYYPLHLGVTEAGEGMEGRIKSSLGIGTLLEDGIGDTIRVSLTENPEDEIPVAEKIVNRYYNRSNHDKIESIGKNPINPFECYQRETHNVLNIGADNVPCIINDLTSLEKVTVNALPDLGYTYVEKNDKWEISDLACDYIDIGNKQIDFEIPGALGVIQNYSIWKNSKKEQHYPLLSINEYLNEANIHPVLNFLYITINDLSNEIINKSKNDSTLVFIIDTWNKHGLAEQRRIFIKLINSQNNVPVIISRAYGDLSSSDLQLDSSIDIGGLLIDGLGNGIYLAFDENKSFSPLIRDFNITAFGILQATRTRITQTDYISCPSCGRTQFDLMETTAKVREQTSHLKGMKIAVMGCIVNGPGEMADAHYGYVGTGFKKISLYKKQDVIRRNVDSSNAVEELINIIKDNGDWVDP